MRNITIELFLIVLFGAFSLANNFIDIYFGNGVWNSYEQAKDGKDAVWDRLVDNNIINQEEIALNSEDTMGKKYAFKVAYNWHGIYKNDTHEEQIKKYVDIAETYIQLKKAGQLKNSSINSIFKYYSLNDDTPGEFDKKVKGYIYLAEQTNLSNALEMSSDYREHSFDLGHKVLLVSHSQGNLWANQMVKDFTSDEYGSFANVAVATPADRIEAEGRYTTLSCDRVIRSIPNSMPYNIECEHGTTYRILHKSTMDITGHEFIRSYLGEIKSEFKIINQDIQFYLLVLGGGNDNTDNNNTNDGGDSNDNNSSADNGNNSDDNSTTGGDDNNTTDDPTQDPNKVCVSNYFKYYGDGKIHDSLKKGDKDAELYSDGTKHQVKEMQEFLEAFGYDVGSHGADGWFGSDTKDALIAFQDANGLDADGIVGPKTRDAMNNQNCYDK